MTAKLKNALVSVCPIVNFNDSTKRNDYCGWKKIKRKRIDFEKKYRTIKRVVH